MVVVADLVLSALDDLVPDTVRCGVRPIAGADASLLIGEELHHVRRAVATRRSEFAAGRALLRQLTGTHGAIGVLPNRAPDPPPGWVVSLAHDPEIVVAIAAPRSEVDRLGVDVEPIAPLDPGVAAIVLRPDDDGVDPLAAFVMKEAAYKAWSEPDRPILEHHDVRLRIGPGPTAFTAEVVRADLPGPILSGRFARAANRWIAVAVL